MTMQSCSFQYIFPGNGDRSSTYMDATGNIKFYPPVYEQRYHSTIAILSDPTWSSQIKKVVDFGCSEMKFLFRLRRVLNIEHIIEVDTDENVLANFTYRALPLSSDYINPRLNPLQIDILKGSIDEPVECLKNTDAVIALEVIEHLEPEIFERVPMNIFGYMQPKLAIFTTPNADFNVLFNGILANGFRHPDHKFEWTRQQFCNWAFNICSNFPNYSVFITGIGKAPPKQKHVGRVSQFALFARNDMINRPLAHNLVDVPSDKDKCFKQIHTVNYPHFMDLRTRDQNILDEIIYHINRLINTQNYYNAERNAYEVPIEKIHNSIETLNCSMLELTEIIKNQNYSIENGNVIVNNELINEQGENIEDNDGTAGATAVIRTDDNETP